jgi:hypothetical protein
MLVIAALSLASGMIADDASACGGFFCNQGQPVNQAAERIVFAQNDDGTVTAVIEIMYQGPSENFSWLLPISSIPANEDIGVASSIAFQNLQQATNPQYTLTTRVEGRCDESDLNQRGGPTSASADNASGGFAPQNPGVMVEASGVVGPYDYTVISVDERLPEPADTAIAWLEDNDYDVPSGSRGLLGPYLEDGMFLLALRLTKGMDSGSIRPLVITYEATRPMIPIKLTAVAANQDMGVMAWVLGSAQAVPKNYNALELNEARINWFNPNSNYNQVVIAAADEAGGHGFVTEYAQASTQLAQAVWPSWMAQQWQQLQDDVELYASRPASEQAVHENELFQQAAGNFAGWDGFWEVVEQHVTLPLGTNLDQLKMCPGCYMTTVQLDPPAFLAALEEQVIEPVRVVQKLIDAHPQVTRLYTTMSAEDMTVDPLFTFNPSLEPVSNIHTAERIIECRPDLTMSEAPWRIELPQGGMIRGTPENVGTWPGDFDAQPATLRITQQGESGSGKVLQDNTASIQSALTSYNEGVPRPAARSSGCSMAPSTASSAWLAVLLALPLLRRRQRT